MPLTSALCHWRIALLLTTAYLGSLFYSPIAAQPGWDFSDNVNAAGISQSSHSSTTKKKDSSKTESSKTDSSKKKTSSKSDSSKEKSSKGSDTKTDSSKKASTDKKKDTENGKSAQSKKDSESKKTDSSKSSSKSSSKESEKKKTDSSKTDSKKNDSSKTDTNNTDAKKKDLDSKPKTEDANKKSDASKPEEKSEEKPQEPAPQQVIVTSTENQKDTRNIAVEVVSSTMEHAADAGKSGLKSIINLPKALAGGAMRLTETFIKTGRTQTGTASFYGSDWHGQKTASGETFDMNTLTAAHRTLPFNTHVLVTNLRNGKQTVVRINNRGPFSGGRIIDLSRAAAEKIGMIGSGVAPVKLEILKR